MATTGSGADDWICSGCDLDNHASRSECVRCYTARPQGGAGATADGSQSPVLPVSDPYFCRKFKRGTCQKGASCDHIRTEDYSTGKDDTQIAETKALPRDCGKHYVLPGFLGDIGEQMWLDRGGFYVVTGKDAYGHESTCCVVASRKMNRALCVPNRFLPLSFGKGEELDFPLDSRGPGSVDTTATTA